jgi:cytochrome c oxidase cbb3-type subunit 3
MNSKAVALLSGRRSLPLYEQRRTPAADWRCVVLRVAALPLLPFIVLITLGAPARAQTLAQNQAAVQRGQKDFESRCAFCHGTDATGGRGPDLVRSKLVADDAGGNLIGGVILNGRPAKGMPAFSMAPAQIKDIAAFLHSRVLAAMHSRSRGGDVYSLSRLLTGNAAEGKAYFDGPGRCSACHSPTGDLAHIAAKYTPLKLELRMLYPRGITPTVTVTLRSGKHLTGKLVHLDEFSVALRDSSGWYRSFSRDQVQVEVHDPLAAHQALLNKLTQDDMHNLFAYLETLK